MSKKAMKTPAKGGIDLDAMSLKDLIELEGRLKKAITVVKERERASLKQMFETEAQQRGFTLQELLAGRTTKGKTVAPKYQNPDNKAETWTGRGRKPKWLAAKLEDGANIDDFAI
ncbi:MAG: H-NS family nucleoid-associated regulatory protein [Hyphomicrobiaceae bacterium]